ncbi:uncharacterized protein LOC125051590 [Pieris napi]|uniref:uncharacterized protein LOC125051590 n=1 Tax=Pieris napi TaxID=78633 RepID=UPI001FBB6C23|nr:uncharacterized protein LOC125051590 [Pieris napi]
MWKYVTRRLRDTIEKSANHFDKRSSAFINTPNEFCDENNKKYSSPCCWFNPRKCWSSYQNDDTKSKKWNFDHLNRTWIGAITWSSALVFGWYAGQLIHLNIKNQVANKKYQHTSINSLLASLQHLRHAQNANKLDTIYEIAGDNTVAPVLHLISNDPKEVNKPNSDKSSDSSSDDLGEVLNSIENKLGLAAIENGQHKDGLNLLRSAANRNHPPALYNLGLCYEMGLGVKVDEKVAMELYRSAATLHHPGALYNLGIYYGQGRGGLTKDIHTATRLLRLAAVQGQQDAISALNTLDVDIKEPSSPQERGCWTKQYSPLMENGIIPTYSSLFVDNVTPMTSYNYEPIVY